MKQYNDAAWAGLDPGTRCFGLALLERLPSGMLWTTTSPTGKVRDTPTAKLRYVDSALIDLGDIDDDAYKLTVIFQRVHAWLSQHRPSQAAIEQPVLGSHGNVTSAATLTRAGGAALAAAGHFRALTAKQLYPATIKTTLTGNQHAGKPEIRDAVRRLFPDIERLDTMYHDEIDAIAIAAAACIRAG